MNENTNAYSNKSDERLLYLLKDSLKPRPDRPRPRRSAVRNAGRSVFKPS